MGISMLNHSHSLAIQQNFIEISNTPQFTNLCEL